MKLRLAAEVSAAGGRACGLNAHVSTKSCALQPDVAGATSHRHHRRAVVNVSLSSSPAEQSVEFRRWSHLAASRLR